MPTTLLYMEGFDVLSCVARVEKIEEHNGKQVLTLERTCFYPKGGGQDYDTGTITDKLGNGFRVEQTTYLDGEVKHIGDFIDHEFMTGARVTCEVDEKRRKLNTQLHSAGHAIDMAVRKLGYDWTPTNAAHYPNMAFVEYSGEFNTEQKNEYITAIQAGVDELIANGTHNHIEFMTPEKIKETGAVVPANLPTNKPTRVMFYDSFAVPCGGTHVKNLNLLPKVNVSKIKNKNGSVRVSYKLPHQV